MKHFDTQMHTVTTQRVVGFGAAVRSLGKHRLGSDMVYYSAPHIRMVLQGQQKSKRLLLLIAEKCPMMFDICKTCDEVQAWWKDYKAEIDEAHDDREADEPPHSTVGVMARMRGEED